MGHGVSVLLLLHASLLLEYTSFIIISQYTPE